MFRRALEANLELDPDHVEEIKQGRDPMTKPKTPSMDRKANKKRTIRASDLVHDSVFRIEKAGRFPANNVPEGLAKIDDDGNVTPRQF